MKAYSILILAGLLAACGGGSGSSGNSGGGDNGTPPGNYTPVTQNLSQLSLLDASGKPLSEAQVTISPKNTAGIAVAAVLASNSVQLTADSNGHITFPDLAPGSYTLTITISGVTVTTTLEIRAENASGSSTVAAPLVITDNGAESLEGQGFFASLSGIIFDADGPLNNAQIEISGGAATNGAIATATTDNDGHFVLIVNVSLSKLLAIKTATIRISRDGYGTRVIPLDLTQISALSGLNFSLQAATGNSDALYSENFEQPVSEAACGSWMTVSVSQSYTGTEEGPGTLATLNAEDAPAEATDEELQNLWHSHNAGLNIINQALTNDLVLLAPDDTSAGKVPDPLSNRACWYGQAASGGVTQGNFLGEPEEPQEELDGGTSLTPNGGAIVSPDIDLSAETGPLSLTFRTWWEIEAVNPNENGFDLMTIEYSTDDIQWTPIARLNPLSDPVGLDDQDRAPLPYSNRGYNKAPAWLWQEPIDISDLAGEQIKLRFLRFNTQDELYNGFRGWLVDDISIKREAGTFPRYIERRDYLQPNFSLNSGNPVPANESWDFDISGTYVGNETATLKLVRINGDGSQTVLDSQQVTQNDGIDLAANIVTPADGMILLALQMIRDGDTAPFLQYDLYYPVSDELPPEEETVPE